MYEVPLPSATSPLLRRAGSKPIFTDPDSTEPAVANDLGLVFLTKVNEMKSPSMAASSVAMIPSPIFLWRFKVLLFLMWGISCCKIGWDSVMQMNTDKRHLFLYEAFLYFNPLLLVTLMVWLWGANLWVFSQSSVNYAKVFDLDHTHLTYQEIWKCATWMTIIVPTSMAAYLYLYSHGEVSLAASQPVLLYAAILMVLIFPFEIFYLPSRYYLLRTVWRIILPLQAITFSDFFLADIMTSMSKIEDCVWCFFILGVGVSITYLDPKENQHALQVCRLGSFDCHHHLSRMRTKVFSDLERSVCRMFNRQVATIAWFEADSVCGSHSVVIPVVLVFPYVCRFFQCLRQYKDTKERTCLFNALKYSTAVPVIFLSALKYHVLPVSWTNFYRPLWLISSVINSLYSFYWDLTRDWDLSVFSRIFKFKNPHICTNLFYGRIWVYYWVMGSNLILRCTWTYKLSAHLRHNHLTVFTITALEIMRRCQWILFRVENEWNKMMMSKPSLELSINEIPEEDRLLGSANHNV